MNFKIFHGPHSAMNILIDLIQQGSWNMTYKNGSLNMDPSPYLQIFHIEPCDSSCSEGRASDAVHSHHEGLLSGCNEKRTNWNKIQISFQKGINSTQFLPKKGESVQLLSVKQHFQQHFQQHFEGVAQHFKQHFE